MQSYVQDYRKMFQQIKIYDSTQQDEYFLHMKPQSQAIY